MSSGLLTAGSGHAWETDLVAALDRSGSIYAVVRRCADLADVLATAATGVAVAAVLSSDLRRLDSEAVRRLDAVGVVVVVVYSAADPRAPVRLGRIGIGTAIPDDAGSAAILAAVAEATGRRSAGPGGPQGPGTSAPGRAAAVDSARWADARKGAVDAGAASGDQALTAMDQADDEEGAGPIGSPGWFSRVRRRPGPRRDPVVSDPASALAGGGSGSGWPAGSAAAGENAEGADPACAGAADPRSTRPDDRRPSIVVAVWGPTGAPGRSTVAMGIADEAAAAGATVLLIDADVYGGVLAAAFGLLDESPGLAGACRSASNGRLDRATLIGLCWSLAPRLTVLTGIARADRWPEVRPSAIPIVLAQARVLADVVVVDCAPIVETDEEISYDTMAPRRNGATLAVLADADVVLAVGAGDPPGVERLVRGLAELADAVPDASPRVVVNRIRRTAASRREIDDALARFAGLGVSAHLPEDRAATDAAWRRCAGLSVAAPRSGLRQGLAALVRDLLPWLDAVPMPADGSRGSRSPDADTGGDRDGDADVVPGIARGWSPGRRVRGRHSGRAD